MNQHQAVQDLLRSLGSSRIYSTAYDTAWGARLFEVDPPMAERALGWLRSHQLPDGSWGAASPLYWHDRAICTLSAMVALALRGEPGDKDRIAAAQRSQRTLLGNLHRDLCGEAIGFEVLAPMLIEEAVGLGLIEPGSLHSRDMDKDRAHKLGMLPERVVDRTVTLGFSAEMAGSTRKQLLNIEKLQEVNGSIGNSPSATAYYVSAIRRGDIGALEYLRRVQNGDGGFPDVHPFDIFERAWVLRNLSLADALRSADEPLWGPHVDALLQEWQQNVGVCWASGHEPKDGDDTAVAYLVLARLRNHFDHEALLHYERDDHFMCFPLETMKSVSAQIHLLEAFRVSGYGRDSAPVAKLRKVLKQEQNDQGFWFDKWHLSPYYPTAQAIIALADYGGFRQDAGRSIDWILSTQRPDGSWGYWGSTAEETALCVQAISYLHRLGKVDARPPIESAMEWLARHSDPPFPPLWIGKALYCPELVVTSEVISAMAMGASVV